ncbi:tRNA uridine-5-carboxymethylaminomethyl(34) synthesis GTPase MnmE [Roseomonas sp. BU-1]|uniref:tRNA modification GTPase MnmE n=2 Tax=Falsiroseomonas selenitidurans TaxID=2716335 RepID=A0ABX1EC29_9PROT|nr:tRNA uridine-5-carboxymethylaminomethyl(34) synthesis GTPase MnmE [Falsiroseomonas selenitidurans]NKC34408.1 tRNA uridine-5-carboxymethylaminomethyl(34) synthesis GTPase MnmE [Falsiroseomonas selenitidurans]
MARLTDTIFARASGAVQAAVAVLRLSGPGSGALLAALAGGLPPARRASLRRLRDAAGEVLDQALVLWFPGPASYSGEDCGELHLHGGAAVVSAVEAALLALGARPAEPGEFTRRAFLNGRMDLTQAEAVADLVAAETDGQRRQALRQADGALGQLYGGWSERLTRLLAQQEAAIEFEMDDLPTDLGARARQAAAVLRAEMAAHLQDGHRGERLREGVSVAIVGAPNAGKSSLLNALVGRDAAIVSAQPGTTRDVVECRLVLAGVPVTLADTAGLREASDLIEQEGVRRALDRAAGSDLLLAAFEAGAPPDAATLAALAAAERALVIGTKCDLLPAPENLAGHVVLPTSVRTRDGLGPLLAALERAAIQLAGLAEAPSLTRSRHRAALGEALARLEEGEQARLPELAAEGFRSALLALGRLTGRVEVEQVLDAVFRDFCIGK